MSGDVHAKAKHEAQPPIDWSQPPTASDGADAYIRKLLYPVTNGSENGDVYQGMVSKGEGSHKTTSRIHKFLKWSGIAFAVAMGGTILKKAITNLLKNGEKELEEVAVAGGKAVAKHL